MERYLNNVRAKGARLAELKTALAAGDAAAEEQIRALAHALHGSGGAFGFPELSLAGKSVEFASSTNLAEYLAILLAQIETMCNKPAPGSTVRTDAQPGRLSALVAESNPINATIISNSLRKLKDVGECTVANTAMEACNHLVNGKVDLLVLELVLPDGDGREILRDISKVLGVNIPTLVMSGVSNDTLYMECMKLGAQGYLTKPFDSDTLVQEVEKLVRYCRQQKQAAPAAPAKSPDTGAKTSILEGKNILIAEDDPLQADLISARLGKEGANVIHCRDGRETLDYLKAHPVSLVLLDVNMPLLDGFTVLEAIRGELGLHALPVILLTAMGSEENVIRGYDLGASDYILKPYSEPQLIGRIKGLLKRLAAT